MANEVLAELWNIKDGIAIEHGYDIDKLAKYYRQKQSGQGKNTVGYASHSTAEKDVPPDPSAAATF